MVVKTSISVCSASLFLLSDLILLYSFWWRDNVNVVKPRSQLISLLRSGSYNKLIKTNEVVNIDMELWNMLCYSSQLVLLWNSERSCKVEWVGVVNLVTKPFTTQSHDTFTTPCGNPAHPSYGYQCVMCIVPPPLHVFHVVGCTVYISDHHAAYFQLVLTIIA